MWIQQLGGKPALSVQALTCTKMPWYRALPPEFHKTGQVRCSFSRSH
ncbi:hypothetical protein [Nitrospira sp. KM1]|nr:hypothetical protein [Nitrospira sp. KM1]